MVSPAMFSSEGDTDEVIEKLFRLKVPLLSDAKHRYNLVRVR